MIDLVDIKDISGNIRFSTPINEGSKRKFQLMKEDYITLKFSVDDPVYFKLGDGIDNELGIFELVDMYKPTYNDSTGGYDYELRLDAYYWKWKNKKFFYTPEDGGREASWNLTATLEKHMAAFIKNLNKLGYKFRDLEFKPEIDETVEQSSKLISYDNCNLIDALTQMAEAWECEWWIENHQIRFGRCEFSDPVDLELGVNVNKMDRSDSQNRYASRIYAFGSTRNIPPTYRKKLIFDVKKVDGRDISDTSRALESKFFPSNNILGEHLKGKIDIDGSFPKEERQYRCTIVSILAGGTYSIPKRVVPFMVSGIIGTEWYPPVGTYYYRLELCYKKDGVSHIIFSESKEYYRGDKNTDSFKDTFNLPSSIKIEKGGADLEAILTTKVQTSETRYVANANIVRFELDLLNVASSSTTSVTFISGNNKGQSYPSIYNPDFLTGDDANVIRLPEGITVSVGDIYTIDNIIKGKVPDKYFSKDDNETTINSVVQKRLMLPVEVPYVDADKNMTQEEAIEEIVIFEDIYAKYIGSITEKPTIRYEFEKDNEDKPTEKQYPIYRIKDANLKNFTTDFVIDKLRLVFQTGTLVGLDFALDLKTSDDTGTVFEIYRSDDYGRFLPDDVLFPQEEHTENGKEVPADTYILYGFDTAYLSEDMLPNAEEELLKKAQEYVEKSKIDPSTYNCEMNSSWVFADQLRRTFTVGDKVNLINKAYFDTGRQSRIIGYEFNLDIPYDHPVYTVGETAAYSRIGEIESKIDSLTFKGLTYSGLSVTGGGNSVYVIGVNDKTLPSDRNTFSAKRVINEIVDRSISKTGDDSASGIITFLKGLISEVRSFFKGGITTDILESQDFTSGTLGSGHILKRDPNTGESYFEVDKAYIRKKATFSSLEIKEAYHVGGEQIQTLASIKCTKVEHIYREALFDSDHKRLRDSEGKYLFALLPEPIYRCYFTSTDGSKTILNQFVPGDLAQCRQFDIKDDTTGSAKNRYYWRHVVSVGDNYIDLAVNDCEEGSDIPEAGDKIIQLGNRTDASRQNAIIMSAYGENAPSKQMLAGINSYSLVDKVILEEGFDSVTKKAYTKNYGRNYVGAKDESSYMRYSEDKGLELKGDVHVTGGTINLKVNDNSVWEVDENCVNTIGNKGGEHIEINPSSKNIRIFDENSENTATLEGKKYNDVELLFPIEIPDVNVLPSLPFTRIWKQIGQTIENLSLTDAFYTDTNIVVSCPHRGIIQVDTYNPTACRYRMTVDTYSDAQCTKIIDSSLVTDLTVKVFGTNNIAPYNNNLQIPAGYHKVNLQIGSNMPSGGSCVFQLSTFYVDIKIDSYMSKYFGNGMVLGTGNKNLFSVMSKEENGNKYVSMLARNDNYGISFDYDGVYSYNEGNKGMLPSIICYGSAGTNTAGAFLNRARTFDGSYLSVSRLSQGVCRITFPASWKNLNIGVGGNAYIMLTGTGLSFPGSAVYPIKATFKAWLQGTGFDVYLSDDETPNDGEFYFEVKWF